MLIVSHMPNQKWTYFCKTAFATVRGNVAVCYYLYIVVVACSYTCMSTHAKRVMEH